MISLSGLTLEVGTDIFCTGVADQFAIRRQRAEAESCNAEDINKSIINFRWQSEMAKHSGTKSVPQNMRATYDTIVALTDKVCRDHLDNEYRELAQLMAAALCRKLTSPVSSGQPRTWACAIIYVLGQINFLSDRSMKPYMTMTDVCTAFGVGQSTASAKARIIFDTLKTYQLDPKWSLQRLLDKNPLVWMAEVNGILVDLRQMPREVQEIAFQKGMIPYIPADRG